MQGLLSALFPPQCVSCGALTESGFGLCPACWRLTEFITGLVCDGCGVPLPGEDLGDAVLCDDCLAHPRPWSQGRAALVYRGNGRRLVLALKASDRSDLAVPAGNWMAAAAAALQPEGAVLVPVPLHWARLFGRRYNQAALLAQSAGKALGLTVRPDALIRPQATMKLEGLGRAARETVLEAAIRPHPRRGGAVKGRRVILVDDVMTTGATLAAAASALRQAGAAQIMVLTLARTPREA